MGWGYITALALLWQPPVTGAEPPDALEVLTNRAIEITRAHAGSARLPNGRPLPAATEEDRRLFAIPTALETQTVHRGFLTGQLEYCRFDGLRRSFGPYMARLRASGRYSQRQLAYVAMLHGTGQGIIMHALASAETDICAEPGLRDRLTAAADAMPIETP